MSSKIETEARNYYIEDQTKRSEILSNPEASRDNKAHAAYWYLNEHWIFETEEGEYRSADFQSALDITVFKVNPETREVEPENPNAELQVWLETGPYEFGIDEASGDSYPIHVHDPELDSFARDFYDALIDLAGKVKAKYGDFRSPEEA